MKNIKNLKIKTTEGLEVKNLQRFPSMEWGDEGGLQAEVHLNGKLIGTLYQAGNGGCANFTYNNSDDYAELAKAIIIFLKRVDKNYGPNSKYNWLKNKATYRDIGDDDIEAAVNNIEERYDDIQVAKKIFKKGYQAVALLKNDFSTQYLQYKVADITMEEVNEWLIHHPDIKKKYPEVTLIRSTDNLTVL